MKNSLNELVFELQKEKCPKGIVSIRKSTKDDLIQEKPSFYNQSMFKMFPVFM